MKAETVPPLSRTCAPDRAQPVQLSRPLRPGIGRTAHQGRTSTQRWRNRLADVGLHDRLFRNVAGLRLSGNRWPRKGLIVFGVTFWSLGTILSGFAEDYWTLLGCRVLVGLGEASYAVLAPTWIADLFSAERRNNALTIFYTATPLGSALGYLLGGFALSHGGWRYGFFWAGAPGLILALILLTLSNQRAGSPAKAIWPGRRSFPDQVSAGSPSCFALRITTSF